MYQCGGGAFFTPTPPPPSAGVQRMTPPPRGLSGNKYFTLLETLMGVVGDSAWVVVLFRKGVH